jgi:ABC-type multidrug transport system fused ATPase/permease subunit
VPNKPNTDFLSLKNIILTFKYWPRVAKLFWETHKVFFVIVIVLNILTGLTPIMSIYFTQQLINSIIIGQEIGMYYTLWFFVAFSMITIFREIIMVLLRYFESLFLTLSSRNVTLKIMGKASSLGLADFEDSAVQDQLKRAKNESGQRVFQVFKIILSIISDLIILISTATFIIVWNNWYAIILILLPLSSMYSLLKIGQEEFTVNWNRAPKQRGSWYLGHLLTHDHAFKEVKMYNLSNFIIRSLSSIFDQFYNEDKKISQKRLFISFFFFIIINLSVVLSVIYQAVWQAYNGIIMIGSLVAYIQAILLIQNTSQSIVNNVINLGQKNMYISQLFQFFELKSTDPVNKQIKLSKTIDKKLDLSHCYRTLNEISSIEFRNVCFTYPGSNKPAISQLNVTINKGETMAIVGKNGSGKSTLIKLLTQLYDNYEGQILINNYPIEQYNLQEVRNRIGIVFQDFMRYELTMRKNIGFGNIEYIQHDDKLIRASQEAGIDNVVNRLPQKLDTQLGRWFEGGQQLSGGQWQRVSIARGYIRNADLYILDEPSAALDPVSEKEVFVKFKALLKNKAGIFITHRYSSIKFADKILVMDNGRIVEQGKHEQLLSINGLYTELYNMQADSYQDKQSV